MKILKTISAWMCFVVIAPVILVTIFLHDLYDDSQR
jgi:hypothetical protein